jgi:hypothetical protein
MAEKKTEDVMKVESTAVTAFERPSFIKTGDHRGTEHITKDDLQIPRLALAQGLTPQVAEGKDGFVTGVLFNSQTEQVYGKGPIDFFIVRADKPRFIEFNPREEGGGIKDMSVSADDPRTRFTTDEEGKSVKPAATKFYDFVIAMLPLEADPMKSIISLSFKSSGLKMARNLNTLVKYRNAPLFAGVYRLTTRVEKNAKGIFSVYNVENAGWVGKHPAMPDEAAYKLAEDLFLSLADRNIIVDRTDSDLPDDADDFDTSKM